MAAELKKLVKELQGASPTEVCNILSVLKDTPNVNEALLRESKAGLAVGKLRTHTTKEVSELAKEIVKKWKTAVDKEKARTGGSSKTVANGKPADKKTSTPGTPLTPVGASAKQDAPRSSKTDGVKGGIGDTTRDKCTELIYDALSFDSSAPVELILRRAQAIEKAVHDEFNSTDGQYKAKIRTLFVNLKDKNNPSLRENVVSGELAAERFSKMTSQDMASEERKAADQKIREANFHNSLSAAEQQAETDGFQCSRCKQRKCRYRQAQTRSADEPMTTFVTCTNCGNKWKFS
ncbi:transcription elongation factor [Crucibulum laeve]|uniref:Transcription elongation factor n=1 Tax=Crucibulum laeve TaxID=68775 RepID=A0A5C3M0N0_9AGAR|nr:transcription elongation factor [Crucibulum laeve]